MDLINQIIELDKSLFLFLNSLHFPLGDSIMTVISSKYTFIPLYLFFIYYILTHSKKKWFVIIGILIAVALSDIGASQIAKPTFKRLRPCHDSSLSEVHIVNNHCGKKYGFFSSHAANTFCLAFFMISAFFKNKPKISIALGLWAFIVSYSRIYLGVHFPLDIAMGGILGLCVSTLLVLLLKNRLKAI